MTPDEISQTFPSQQPAPAAETPNIPTSQPMPPVEQPAVISETPPPPKPKKKLLLIIGIIVILLVLIAVSVFAFTKMQTPKMREDENFPTPVPTQEVIGDDMSDWETFAGGKYKFNYPADYEVTEDESGANVKILHSTAEFVSIYPVETLTYQNFFECSDSVKENCLVSYEGKPVIEDIVVGGQSAKSFYLHGGGLDNDYRRIETLTSAQSEYNTGFTIFLGDINLNSADVATKNKIFDQILSTFEFTSSDTVKHKYTVTQENGVKKIVFPEGLAGEYFEPFEISFPQKWEESFRESDDLSEVYELNLVFGGHEISISAALDGRRCYFDDDKGEISELTLDYRNKEYGTIDTSFGELRYRTPDLYYGYQGPSETRTVYGSCLKQAGDSIFWNVYSPGLIQFYSSEPFGSQIFSEMEEIVKTIIVIK